MLTNILSAIVLLITIGWMAYKLYAIKSKDPKAQRNVKKYNDVVN